MFFFFFFFNYTATTEIYTYCHTLSLHDALPICSVELASLDGAGTRVTIRLPLTLAILDGMSVAVGDDIYILPLSGVVESLQPLPEQIRRVAGEGTVVRVRNEYVPLLPVREWFHVPGASRLPHESILEIGRASCRERECPYV